MIERLDAAYPVVLKWGALSALLLLLLLWAVTAILSPPGIVPPAVLVAPLGTILAGSMGASALKDLGAPK